MKDTYEILNVEQPTLSIIVPSNRKDTKTYEMLEALVGCTKSAKGEIEVVVSDNSNCDKKESF